MLAKKDSRWCKCLEDSKIKIWLWKGKNLVNSFVLYFSCWRLGTDLYIFMCSVYHKHTVRVKDFYCNKFRRCLWNEKSLSEELVSMRVGKLKAHWDFGQVNKFWSCRQPNTSKSRLGSQYFTQKYKNKSKFEIIRLWFLKLKIGEP